MVQGANRPGFKPIGETGKTSASQGQSSSDIGPARKKRTDTTKLSDSEKKIADKKARLAKYGVQFQSAGHLATIQTSSTPSLSSYQAVLLASAPCSKDNPVPATMESLNDSAGHYRNHFVLAGSMANDKLPVDSKELESKVKEQLPNAAGRLKRCSEAAAAAAAEHDSDDEEDFTTRSHLPLTPSARGRGRGSVGSKIPKFSLKLTKHYDSYYY